MGQECTHALLDPKENEQSVGQRTTRAFHYEAEAPRGDVQGQLSEFSGLAS